MFFRKPTSALIILSLLVQTLSLNFSGEIYAAPDIDGSANIDLYLTSTIPVNSLIGRNFSMNIAVENKSTSDGDGFRPGIILSLPTGVTLVSAGALGSPVRSVSHVSGNTLYFFRTTGILLKGTTTNYPITLSSTIAAGVFIDKNIGVLAYTDDNIYGRGAVPSGAPIGTLPGGVDTAAGSGVSMADPSNLTFPDTIIASTSLATLPFITSITQFIPYTVKKIEETKNLIGKTLITTLKIEGNDMGPLNHFHLQDVLPTNRAFLGFLSVSGGIVGGTGVTYDAPMPGQVTLDFTDISVPTGSEITIEYETLVLAYDVANYTGPTHVLNTASVIPHGDSSPNTVTMHTGGLTLSGGPYAPSTWNNGVSNIAVNSASIIAPVTTNTFNRYANLSKSVDNSSPVIGDLLTYTVNLSTAYNAAYTTNGTGTYIEDHLPDGLAFSGTVSSAIVSGVGTPLTFDSVSTDVDGNTTIKWRLNSGTIGANSTARLVYQVVVDGLYEGIGDTEYENTEVLTNEAIFYGTVGDGGLSGLWGQTDPSIVDDSVFIHSTNSDQAIASVSAPIPTTKKHLISVTLPSGGVYDSTTGLPSEIPAGSKLRFALTMDFPEVNFINPKLIDALPLLAGPNLGAYDIAFQTNPALKDITNTGVLFNTNDGVTPAAHFNGLNLLGTTIPNAAWVSATPANNLEFQLNSGVGKKTFAILFTVDVLAKKPVGGVTQGGLVPLTNFAYSTYNDDSTTPHLLPVSEIPVSVNFPYLTVLKTASGGTNVEAGKLLDYTITVSNMGSAPAFLENIIDSLPANMDYVTGSIMLSGAVTTLPNASITQSGNTLLLNFDTGSTGGIRSFIDIDDTLTPAIRENLVVIRYSVIPNTNFVIQGGATRTNTINLDYYASTGAISNGVNNLGPMTTTANVTVKNPSVTRELLSTSESDSITNNLYVGEEVTYRTTITIPNGTFNLARYTETINSNLQFLSGTVTTYSGNLTFSSGTTFSGAVVNFGTIINNDLDILSSETIVIDTTYRVIKNATAGLNYLNNGTFSYSSTSRAASIGVNVVKPIITLTKVASPTQGDAGDTVTFTITANNTSATAQAYDLRLTDLLPSPYMTYVTGSLSLVSFSGSETHLLSMSGGGNGLTIDSLPSLSQATANLQVLLTNNVRPADMYTNRADIIYDTLDDDNSPYEWSGSTLATALVTIPDIILSHTITSTSLTNTTNSLFSGSFADVAIGEQVVYTTVIGFPESSATGVILTQTLPVSMKFLSGYILVDGVKSHTLSNITISPDNILTLHLGNIDNTDIGAGTGIVFVTEAVMLDHLLNTAGSIKSSTLEVDYAEKSKSVSTFVEVVEPALTIVKEYSPNSGDAGDTIPVTITVTNTSGVHAYDVVLTDMGPSKLIPGVGFSGTINIGTLAPGQIATYTYDSIIAGTVGPGELLTGTASILYTSHPGVPLEGERSYTASDTDSVTIINTGSIQLNLLTSSDVKIGDISQYEIKIPVTEGTINTLSISNLIPAGMGVIPGSIVITPDTDVSYSGTVIPVITPDSNSLGVSQTQTVVYDFSTVTNTNTDNATTEYITIRYDAVTQNSTDTNNGSQKIHTVSALYDGIDTKLGTSLPITIREPNIVLSVSNAYTYGNTVPYTFTLTNNGTAIAYDLDLSTLLPLGVSYTGNIILTNSGGALNLVKVGDSFTIESLPVNPGNPLVFTLDGDIAESVPNFIPLTLTGTVVYTSQPGAYISPIANSLTIERTSLGGVDDYIDANKNTVFTVNIPLLDEAISVTDINGGDGIIGDIFEYTITLTNTGNVALMGIPLDLDIPAGFTGFTMITTPAGSIDNSTVTGGANSAGYLSLSGISIPIGGSVTIIYRVRALTTLAPGTVIPTQANVGNSAEGALGGTPSVPVTIQAPLLLSTAVEVDNNGGTLTKDEHITHTLTLSNSGTASGTNVIVTIPWSVSGSAYVSGSILFQSGTLVDTGSVFIDTSSGTLTFTIPYLPVSAFETIVFQTLSTGPVGSEIRTRISAEADEGVSTDTNSNILIIVNNIPGPGGGGNGASGGSGKPVSSGTPLVTIPKQTEKTRVISPKSENPPKNKKPPVSVKKSLIQDEYAQYLKAKKRLAVLIEEENMAGKQMIKNPKVLPQTGQAILSRVKKLVNAKLSLEAPEFKKGDNTLDSYLVNLPKEDQSRDEYIVTPSNGMITPINTVQDGSSDYKKLVSGREIDVNKYLKTGVVTYPGTNTAGFGGVGNTVIFGHSSYWKSDSGRYKTHFQRIIELEKDEEIWVYKKQSDGSYNRYRYVTTQSYEVKPSEVSILDPGIGKNLTLFTCTPIGGINGRWVVKAKFVNEERIALEEKLYGTSLTTKEKKEIQTYRSSLKSLSLEDKKINLEKKYKELGSLKESAYKNYYRFQVAKTYGEL